MKTFSYRPDLNLYHLGDEFILTFDSRCPQDATRGMRSMRIPADYLDMVVKIEGFTIKEDGDGVRAIPGSVHLVVADKNGEKKYQLSDSVMIFSAPYKKGVPQYDNLITPPQVAYAVYQGVSEALNRVLNEQLWGIVQTSKRAVQVAATLPPETTESLPRAKPSQPPRPSQADATNDNLFDRCKSWLTNNKKKVLAVPLVAIVTWWGMSLIYTPPSPVEKAAVAATMNPQDLEAQIRLTTETLKQMGIDPGSPQDMGCITPQ